MKVDFIIIIEINSISEDDIKRRDKDVDRGMQNTAIDSASDPYFTGYSSSLMSNPLWTLSISSFGSFSNSHKSSSISLLGCSSCSYSTLGSDDWERQDFDEYSTKCRTN